MARRTVAGVTGLPLLRRVAVPEPAPDPLEPVLRFDDPADQEIAGLVASSLAFGNVKQILRSVKAVLGVLPAPRRDLTAMRPAVLRRRLEGFRHRYVTGTEMADLLLGARRVLRRHGGLGRCFAAGVEEGDAVLLPALGHFTAALRKGAVLPKNYLLPDPARGSACKRMMMYLRWMLRRDAVDPGPWRDLEPARLHAGLLVIPIDTHMHRIALRLGFTKRKAADMRTALEVTEAFRTLRPEDPVRYDFALTRLGIRKDTGLESFVEAYCAWRQR